jgi:hypothetical protein
MLLSLDSYRRNTVASRIVKIEIFGTLNFELNGMGDVMMLRLRCLGHQYGSGTLLLQNIAFLD